MAVYSDNREPSFIFGGYIEEVQQFLRANQIEFGTPLDFQNLARTFKNDARLRDDLVSLSRSIMERDQTVTPRKILTIIAAASGEPDLALSESDATQPIDLTDLIRPIDENRPASMENYDCHAIEPDYEKQSTHSSDAEDPSILDPIASGPTHPADHYAESLTRLELNSLQMKHYLDSIDQRIRRMEPRLDGLPEYVSIPAVPKSGQATDAKYSSAIATENVRPQPENKPLPPTQGVKPRGAPIDPRQALSAKRSVVHVSAGLATVAVVLASLLYWSFHRNTSSTTIHPVTADLIGAATTAPLTLAPPADDNPSSLSQSPTKAAQQSNLTANEVPPESTDHTPSSKPTQIRLSTSSPSFSAVGYPSNAAPAETYAASPPASSPTSSSAIPERHIDSSPSTIRRINVSSGVMAANVLSAPQPSYPKLASLTHMQGEVVMQAVISKLGKIEDVHVIKGHRLLRSAATNAVRTWRYRPFLVNGRPVEVATIITVDFRLPR